MWILILKAWLSVSVLATAGGWLLSAIHQLNVPGYLIFFVVAAIALWLLRKQLFCWPSDTSRPGSTARRLRSRFRRPWPLCFGVLALLIFIGGVLYPPTNHTGLSYRLPRVLHWLAEHQWHWIHTPNYRMNNRACGIEWLSAPVILFTKSDRLLFLLNFIPFLLLPGLIFSVWTRFGVRARVAWHWMWIVPTGYVFLLQAGSIGNDAFPTVYALASVDFALRALPPQLLSTGLQNLSPRPPRGTFWNLAHSVLAASLLTGAKASNLPLLLPWAVALIVFLARAAGLDASSSFNPCDLFNSSARRILSPLRSHPLTSLAMVLLAAFVSFIPTALLNLHFCRDWSGLNLERAGMNMRNPIVGIWGNLLILLLHNLLFPLFPLARWWNAHALGLLPHSIAAPLNRNFEDGFHIVGELPTEDWSGLGFGVSFLAAASLLAALYRKRQCRHAVSNFRFKVSSLLLIAPWLALLAYCMKSGMVTGARLIAPYYPLLLPVLLVSASQSHIVRHGWWRALVWVNFGLALLVLVLTPPRPLWPARTILSQLSVSHPANSLLARASGVYSVYATRSDPLANVRTLLPQGLRKVGFMGNEDDIEISFWRPFLQTRVCDLFVTDSSEYMLTNGIQYAVVGGLNLKAHDLTLDQWLQRTGAELVATTNATIKLAEGPQDWHVTRVRPH
jgi:hypothetical protein